MLNNVENIIFLKAIQILQQFAIRLITKCHLMTQSQNELKFYLSEMPSVVLLSTDTDTVDVSDGTLPKS